MFDINHILTNSGSSIGLLAIGVIIFLESGVPVGFFLPGDTLLFTAGFFASQHYLPIWGVIAVVIFSEVIGSNLGYELGKKAGRKLFNKEGSFLFRKDYLDSAESFYEKHGGKTVLLGQFIPVVRTFAPVVAGVSIMKRRKFVIFNILGAILWGFSVPLLGYWLGTKIHNIDNYLIPIVVIATIFSFAPAAWHLFGKREVRDKIIRAYRNRKIKK